MAENVFPFGLGLVSGVVLVAVIILVIRELNRQQQLPAEQQQGYRQPQMTSYNVVRDGEGRITNVESLSGLGVGAQQPQRGQISPGQRAAPEAES